MKVFKINSLLVLLTVSSGLWAQTSIIPAGPQESAILLRGATAHLGTGEVIENAVIAFEEGTITLVGPAGEVNYDAGAYDVMDVSGKHVYPGFILPATNLGLVEVGAMAASRDYAERGAYNPNVRSLIAYNTDSELIPTMRFMGILLAQVSPGSGVISGTSSVVQLDAWNWEDAAYAADDAIHLNWPSKMFGPRWWRGETEPRKNPNYEGIIQDLHEMLKGAVSYGKLEDPKAANLKMEALQGLFDGSKALHIHTNDAKEMVKGIKMAKQYGVERTVIVGGHEAMLVKDFLLENEAPVVLTDVHRLPEQDHEDTVYPYKLPKALQDAGIPFCFGFSEGMTARARNLPFYAGTAVAYGLDYEEAVAALTANTAEILGISDRTGTLERGKDANLFVSSGDAFEMREHQVEHAFIQGRSIQLEGRQEFLYKKYSEKFGHK